MKIWKIVLLNNKAIVKKWYYESEKQYKKWLPIHKNRNVPAGLKIESFLLEAKSPWRKL